MKYTIVYGRKVRSKAYESLEISLIHEFDDGINPDRNESFNLVKNQVEEWIEDTRDKLLEKSVSRPR
jgi:hypothetical protein